MADMSKAHQSVVVTGASTGIGAEFCRQLAPRARQILAVSNEEERGGALSSADLLEQKAADRPNALHLIFRQGRKFDGEIVAILQLGHELEGMK